MTPFLARSVGFGPVFFPPEGRLRLASVHAEPRPVDPVEVIVLQQAGLPKLEEHPRFHPFLEAIVGGGARTDAGRIESLPLAACAQDEEDRVHAIAVGASWPATAETVRIHMLREEQFHLLPQIIRDDPFRARVGNFHVESS